MQLFRPVGLRELQLIAASEFRIFPPRLPHQAIDGSIEVIASFTGPSYAGTVDPVTHLQKNLELPSLWAVWRQDDNGNRVVVNSNLREAEARALVDALEAKGHKQMYWAERSH